MRWDYATPYHEQYGRVGQFDPNAPNANAGGHPGATIYANTCNCNLDQPTYPYAIGPRLGLAYQIDPKTVLRAGWGINYQFVGALAGNSNGIGTNGTYPLAGINPYVNIQTPGSIVAPVWPVTDPNRFPVARHHRRLSGRFHAGCEPEPSAAHQSMERRHPAGAFQGLRCRSVLRRQSRCLVERPLGFLSQTSAAEYAKYGLYPYPGTGPAGYEQRSPIAICCFSRPQVPPSYPDWGTFCPTPASQGPRCKVR